MEVITTPQCIVTLLELEEDPKVELALKKTGAIQTMLMLNKTRVQDKQMPCLLMLLGPAMMERPLWRPVGPEKLSVS